MPRNCWYHVLSLGGHPLPVQSTSIPFKFPSSHPPPKQGRFPFWTSCPSLNVSSILFWILFLSFEDTVDLVSLSKEAWVSIYSLCPAWLCLFSLLSNNVLQASVVHGLLFCLLWNIRNCSEVVDTELLPFTGFSGSILLLGLQGECEPPTAQGLSPIVKWRKKKSNNERVWVILRC